MNIGRYKGISESTQGDLWVLSQIYHEKRIKYANLKTMNLVNPKATGR